MPKYVNKERAHAVLKEERLDAIIATHPRNVTYLSDYPQLHECTPSPTVYAVLPADPKVPPVVVTRVASLPILRLEGCWIEDAEPYAPRVTSIPGPAKNGRLTPEEALIVEAAGRADLAPTPDAALARALKLRGLESGRLGVDEAGLTPLLGLKPVAEALPNATLVPAAKVLSWIRLVKTTPEIERLRRAAQANEAGFKAVLRALRPGVSEVALAEAYRRGVWQAGGIPHYPNIGVGTRGAIPTRPPAHFRARKGDLVKLDLDCIRDYYFGDMGRTAVIGKAPARVRDYYGAVVSALEATRAAVRPGVKPSALYHIAVQTARKAGIPQISMSYIGHAIGMWCYDGLLIHPSEDRPLESGMVLNLEPSHYELGLGAFHAEDTVVVTSNGCESLQRCSFRLYEI